VSVPEPLAQALTTVVRAPDIDVVRWRVVCRECGDVTLRESEFIVEDASLQQAGLYRQRHLARHLIALSAEALEAAR
jgi:hypothetical protein